MGYFYFLFIVISLFAGIYFLLSWQNKKLVQGIMQKLNLTPEQSIRVQYVFSSASKFAGVAAYPMKAAMYVTHDHLLIVPAGNPWLNAMNAFHLPILIGLNMETSLTRSHGYHEIKPHKICRTKDGSIKMEFNRDLIGTQKYVATVKVLDKERLGELKNKIVQC